MIERLGAAIGEQLGRLGAPASTAPLVELWPRLAGDAIARNAWPARVARDGTLLVTTSSSAWAFELTQLEPELLGRFREELGPAAPTRLRFAPGRLPEPAAPAAADRAPAPPPPGPQERAAAAELTARIEDEDLRALIARAAAASLARASSGRAV
jgi:hypothetical protein